MGGAYTSKPDAASTVDVPTGWNPEWTHPGPWPPGYTPTLTIVSTGAASISYDGSINAVSTLYDQGSYETTDPEESLTYTATMGGAAVGMRWSGGSSYATTLTKVFSDLGVGFYGNDQTIEFDLEESDGGETVIVTVAGTPWDQSVSDTVIVTITDYTLSTVLADSSPEVLYYNSGANAGKLKLYLNVVGAPGWSGDNLGPTTWTFKVGGATRSSGTLTYNWPNGANTNPAFAGVVDVDIDSGEGSAASLIWETEGSFFGEVTESPAYDNQGFKAVGVTGHDPGEYTDGQKVEVTGLLSTPWAKLTWNYSAGDWVETSNPDPYSTSFFLLEDLGATARGSVFGMGGECLLDSGVGDCSGTITVYAKGDGTDYYLCETRSYTLTSGDAKVRINKTGEYMPVWTENE